MKRNGWINMYCNKKSYKLLSCAVLAWMAFPVLNGGIVHAADAVYVTANAAKEEAKYESQQTQIITSKDIEQKQAKSAEDIVFSETGVSRTVDAMGRVGVSIRGAEPRHTLILIDGQPALGGFAKYQGAGDELMRIGTENLDRIQIVQGAASAKYGSDAIGGVINVITKRPTNKSGMQFNMESVRLAEGGETGLLPKSNFFLRADSGKVGPVKVAVYGSKRDVLPVYAVKPVKHTGLSYDNMGIFNKNSLRYYGESSNIGASATVEINKDNTLDFHMDRYVDNLERYVKHSDSIMEPEQHFKRNINRKVYSLAWNGKVSPSTDMNAELNYTRIKEDDITLTNYEGHSIFIGNNELDYVDNVDHQQYDFHVNGNTLVGDEHVLSYGVGIRNEKGEGSRLRNAPITKLVPINPWDYDKNLYVRPGDNNNVAKLQSHVHDYKISLDDKGAPRWDYNYEWYGYDKNNPKAELPAYTYEEYFRNQKYGESGLLANFHADAETKARMQKFANQLAKQNPEAAEHYAANPDNEFFNNSLIWAYYGKYDSDFWKDHPVKFNGKRFQENFDQRDNHITIGEAEIKKQYAFIQDTWQVNDNTILSPIIRFDHSSMFGSNATFNMGLTHMIHGNNNQRFKANIGTGYTEPGMGELYYNWEMYGGNPVAGGFGGGTARLGWFWAGNPNLKPEKSFNMDMSLEGEKGNTSYRATIFKNSISNYLSVYFTGWLMDFHPEFNENTKLGGAKFAYAPDMIYSFKNIGKAEITGFEAEVNHQFGKHWRTKLGYTYLQALNKSDPNMPKHLLDKPTHKVDISINYEDKKSGWNATLWGDYYIHMLDSNSVSNNGNYMTSYELFDAPSDAKKKSVIEYNFAEGGKQSYETKTYGIWNLMVQKKWGDGILAYVGVDNIFNHRDDDRALQGRTYRFGVNIKFGSDGHAYEEVKDAKGNIIATVDLGTVLKSDFLARSFDNNRNVGTRLIGDYQMQWDWHDGSNRPQVRTTPTMSVGNAEKNMLDPSEHGFRQQLRVGVDAQVSSNTNIMALVKAASNSGTMAATDISHNKGFNHVTVDQAQVTRNQNRWDVSFGRLKQALGTTGYYFNDSFDGVRAEWTGKDTQVRVGYGDFKRSTGIEDSAYTRATFQDFGRAPTVAEFVGEVPDATGWGTVDIDPPANGNAGFHKQLLAVADDPVKANKLLLKMYDLANKAYPGFLNSYDSYASWKKADERLEREKGSKTYDSYSSHARVISLPELTFKNSYKYKYYDWSKNDFSTGNGSEDITFAPNSFSGRYSGEKNTDIYYNTYSIPYNDLEPLKGDGTEFIKKWLDKNKDTILEDYKEAYKEAVEVDKDGKTDYKIAKAPEITEKIIYDKLVEKMRKADRPNELASLQKEYYEKIKSELEATEAGTKLPRAPLESATGVTYPSKGIVLAKDEIPAIHRAAFIDVRHTVSPRVGISAWYLRSLHDEENSYQRVQGVTGNQTFNFDKVASVLGLGAQVQIAPNAKLRFDIGRNMTPLGRYFNGNSEYTYHSETVTFDFKDYKFGKNPKFYTLRLDIGKADPANRGTWAAFADYKYFEHGAFFGGNGTDYLPDRYLDGIRSFTVGGAYVPVKDVMIQAFYTFGATSIGKRDTLFGPESFKLGNYSRVQMTYKF